MIHRPSQAQLKGLNKGSTHSILKNPHAPIATNPSKYITVSTWAELNPAQRGLSIVPPTDLSTLRMPIAKCLP